MKNKLVIIFLLNIGISLTIKAQDTLNMDELLKYGYAKGKHITVKKTSGVTNTKTKIKIRKGEWNFYDEYDNLIKTESYSGNKSRNFIEGKQYIYNEYKELVLVQEYKYGKVQKQTAYIPCVVILNNQYIKIVEQDSHVFIDTYVRKDDIYLNYYNIVTVLTIEDPNQEAIIAMYKATEDSIGNTSLLRRGKYSARHPLNKVSNPSFEKHTKAKSSVTSFVNQVDDWFPASVSPDFYITPSVARSGTSFVGFRVYSKTKDIEYLGNNLTEKLKKGQRYCFSTYLKLGPSCRFATDAFGVFFTNKTNKKPITFEPSDQLLRLKNEVLNFKSRWMLLQCSYIANGTENRIVMGSFRALDSASLTAIPGNTNESYYYMDDVSLIPMSDDEECRCSFNGNYIADTLKPKVPKIDFKQDLEMEFINLEVGESIILENVYFSIGRFELRDKSTETLNKLKAIMIKYPKLKIEISGHTSSTGGYNHNITLSKNRASEVMKYLVKKGIEANRLVSKGYGPNKPIALNDTEVNRQMNRRVEVKVLER